MKETFKEFSATISLKSNAMFSCKMKTKKMYVQLAKCLKMHNDIFGTALLFDLLYNFFWYSSHLDVMIRKGSISEKIFCIEKIACCLIMYGFCTSFAFTVSSTTISTLFVINFEIYALDCGNTKDSGVAEQMYHGN